MTFAGVSCTCSLEYIFHELQQIASKYLKNKGTNNNHTLAIISIANSPPCGREQELQVPLVSLLTSPLRTVNYFRTKYLHYFVALFTNFFKSSNISIKLFYHIITNFSWKIFLSHFHSSCSLLAPILVMKAKTASLSAQLWEFSTFLAQLLHCSFHPPWIWRDSNHEINQVTQSRILHIFCLELGFRWNRYIWLQECPCHIIYKSTSIIY